MAKTISVIAGIPTVIEVQDLLDPVYSETYSPVATVTSGTAVDLPESQTYTGDELSIYRNGQRLDYIVHYTYVGSAPRTQVLFTFDLKTSDDITFRIERP